jgi:hypothetical protein
MHQWSMRSSFKPILNSQDGQGIESPDTSNPLIQANDRNISGEHDKVWL